MSAFLAADMVRLTLVDVDVEDGEPLSLLLAGRRIWSFKAPSTAAAQRTWSVVWPPALALRLTGRAALAVERSNGHRVIAEQWIAFDDEAVELALTEPGTGLPQVVNKWGRLARSFEGREAALVEEVLDETEHLIALLHDRMGIDLFVTGGTLLGPVRDGRIMANDDDADLAYLSVHSNPSDVALESFAVERALLAAGYEVVRHSSGHLQLMFPGRTVSDRFYIDIFSYFICSGWFYGTFHAREHADRVTVLPLKGLTVNGRTLPGPAEPKQLLQAIYGPTWETPDPAFTFVTPPAAFRRYYWWLNHFDVERENWEDRHRAEIDTGSPRRESPLAAEALQVFGSGANVLELGCGLGTDAAFLAGTGRNVLAVDYSRPALVHARSLVNATECPATAGTLRFEAANLTMTRAALHLRRQCLALNGPMNVYGNHLFDALTPLGWDTTLVLIAHLLQNGASRGLFEVTLGEPDGPSGATGCEPVAPRRFEEQLRRYGLAIDDSADVPGPPEDAAAKTTTVQQFLIRKEKT